MCLSRSSGPSGTSFLVRSSYSLGSFGSSELFGFSGSFVFGPVQIIEVFWIVQPVQVVWLDSMIQTGTMTRMGPTTQSGTINLTGPITRTSLTI